jgi:phosphonate transport system ATP-binding protein
VAIARALMQQPKVILADEPIASLDPMNAKVVMDSLQDINLRDGITVVTNLHTLDTARTYCNRIIGMAAGKVVFDGAPEELTRETVRMVYGAEADSEEISEAITSTSIGGAKLRKYEPAKQLQAAFAAR